jgi:2-oxoisovalerate dehydrogenase E1 component alpha subunit
LDGSKSTIASFIIERRRFLTPEGEVAADLPAFANDPAQLIRLYRAMVLTRAFDAKAIALQRTGRLGTYPSSLGQEAVAIGVASAMRLDDVLMPSFREHGAQLWRGVTLRELLLYWGGDERGSDSSGPKHDFPVNVPVGSHAPHAVGVALAFKLRGEARAAVCVFGDGATSKGEVAESLNIAGVWQLPAVFIINNNRWAISVPVSRQTAAATLAQKAIAAGIPGEQVDGNDVIAVREAVERALARAYTGQGPTLIEALTYRLGDHTTADDASRYRDDSDVSTRWSEDPIARLRRYLTRRGIWTKQDEERTLVEVAAEVEAAAEAFLGTPAQAVESMFNYTYSTLPRDLAEQRAEALDTGG